MQIISTYFQKLLNFTGSADLFWFLLKFAIFLTKYYSLAKKYVQTRLTQCKSQITNTSINEKMYN